MKAAAPASAVGYGAAWTQRGAGTEISQLWQYPVKSMIGQQVDQIEVDDRGVVGDRTWATRDEVRGGIRGAKKIGQLMTFAASYDDGLRGAVTITAPDGSSINTNQPDRDRALSDALDHEVTLWPLQPASDLDHYRRGKPDTDDPLQEMRAIFGREDDEPLPDFAAFPEELVEFESPPGTYLDAYPVMLMTTSALAALTEALPDSVIDVRRFRPSIVVDTGDAAAHPEFEWAGRTLRAGGAELQILGPCPRCIMVTRAIGPDIPADRAVLRHIVADLDQNVGVYASVSVAGPIGLGDTITLS